MRLEDLVLESPCQKSSVYGGLNVPCHYAIEAAGACAPQWASAFSCRGSKPRTLAGRLPVSLYDTFSVTL